MSSMLTAIVLQGGGALGAYEFGAIKAIFQRQNFRSHVITGVSIGALAAAVLAGAKGDPLETLEEMWDRFSVSTLPAMPGLDAWLAMFGAHGMIRMAPSFLLAPLIATSIMDMAPLREWLTESVDFDRLNASATRVIITAVNATTGAYEEFDNRDGLTVDHVIASASLPPAFPMTFIDDKPYWDGGLVSNTPLRCAINALEQIDADDPDVKRELIAMDASHISPSTPQTMSDVVGRLLQIYFFGKLRLDLKLFEQFNGYLDLIEHLDQELPTASPLRQHPAYRRLMAHRKIDRFVLISSDGQESIGAATDFSRSSTRRRIERGYRDAIRTLSSGESA